MGFGQNTKIVVLCLIEILALVSLHLQFCEQMYDMFSKTGQIGSSPEFLGSFGSGSFDKLALVSNFNLVMVRIWVSVLHESCSTMSNISMGLRIRSF